MAVIPGSDVPGRSLYTPALGAGGTFAKFVQGFTPKYAINDGPREDLGRNTLARMYVRVDVGEMELFTQSIADEHTRAQLINRLAGDPARQQSDRITAAGTLTETLVNTPNSYATNGYLDFFIQQSTMALNEKFDAKETLSDNYSVDFFGQSPPMWAYTGWLLNTVQDDQATNFLRLYLEVLRGTQLARRQKIINLKIDSYIVTGAMTALNFQMNSNSEIYIPFSFNLLVKRVQIVKYTRGWLPTSANTPFAADPRAILYDGTPRPAGSVRDVQALIPPNLVRQGAPQNTPPTHDARTQANPPPADPRNLPIAPEPPASETGNTGVQQAIIRTLATQGLATGASLIPVVGAPLSLALTAIGAVANSNPALQTVPNPQTLNPPAPSRP